MVDAAHDAAAIHRAVAGRRVTAVVCTHAHDDYIDAAPALSALTHAPVLLHPDDNGALVAHPPGPRAGRRAGRTAGP